MNTLEDQQRLEFESHCRTIGCEWSLEWDKAGFYEDAKADAAFTWFQIGFQQGLGASTTQTASPTCLHVVAVGICEGARVVGAYTSPAIAERVKQVAWDDGFSDGPSVTAVVVNKIDPALRAAMDALK